MTLDKEIGMMFDSSLSSSIETLSINEYKNKIFELVKPILLRQFPNVYQKQQPRFFKDRVSIACPYCGDSTKFLHKKRGNFILEGVHKNFYKCFNCGIFKRTDQFFKDYKVELDLSIINYIVDSQGNFKTSSRGKYDISLLLDIESIEKYAISREELSNKLNLVEVSVLSVEKWLRKRLQFNNDKFLYNNNKNYLVILNLTPSGKILGYQRRALGILKFGQEKYLTYKLSRIYKDFKIDDDIPDEIDALSEIFGIFEIDFNLPITLFEGPLDSFLFRNSIASSGANKNLPFDIEVRYWFDLDKTGTKKSIQYIERDKSIFLWSKFINDIGLPYREKWDLNDVMIYIKENNINVPNFNLYFSTDSLDLIDL